MQPRLSYLLAVAEALERVDQNEVRRMELWDAQAQQRYRVFEYGAGDNSYGAIFASDSSEVMAAIHDGDLLDCAVTL